MEAPAAGETDVARWHGAWRVTRGEANARRQRIPGELVFLSIASAASFAAIDLRYALADRISDIYLLDAVGELAITALVSIGAYRARGRGA